MRPDDDDGELTEMDKARLRGVSPRLKLVVQMARRCVPFLVLEGMRAAGRQAELYRVGRASKHSTAHVHGLAVDLVPTRNGLPAWDRADHRVLAAAMKHAAMNLGVALRWSGELPPGTCGRMGHFEVSLPARPLRNGRVAAP